MFRQKVLADKNVFRFDVPVSDTELVKVHDALDGAPADLIDCDGTHFWWNVHDIDCSWNDRCNEIMRAFGFRLESI